MADELTIEQAITVLGTWLVEHQVRLTDIGQEIHAVNESLHAVEDRLALIEKNWE